MDVNTNIDPLADLGLDTAAEPTEALSSETATTTNEDDMARSTEDFSIGEIEIETVTELPTASRTPGVSKYPFAKLEAPGKNGIARFVVPFKGGDEKKFRRSVQSATTQANRTSASEGKYFESRSEVKDGKFIGIAVYRTDKRPN